MPVVPATTVMLVPRKEYLQGREGQGREGPRDREKARREKQRAASEDRKGEVKGEGRGGREREWKMTRCECDFQFGRERGTDS